LKKLVNGHAWLLPRGIEKGELVASQLATWWASVKVNLHMGGSD
jgi:hypothetical protein